ncbi:hypothetical protein DPMN_177179 [Dreissena polymorpha]|uniref:Uncharacterized protein n=1 Tax=Dreissena polymorpha TaxID=45954 RepID=A0A9D4ILD8_DREPO|nr:hypothetical protein DPMN_177179 [Dreissena polymorpha]
MLAELSSHQLFFAALTIRECSENVLVFRQGRSKIVRVYIFITKEARILATYCNYLDIGQKSSQTWVQSQVKAQVQSQSGGLWRNVCDTGNVPLQSRGDIEDCTWVQRLM